MRSKLAPVLALAALLTPLDAALAVEEEAQLWLSFQASTRLGDGVTGLLEINPRARPNGGDQLQTRANVNFAVAERISVGGAVLYATQAGLDEFRMHQQVVFTPGPLTLRTRLEQRFFSGAVREQWRLRQGVQWAIPVDRATQVSLGGELLYIVQSEVPGRPDQADQWRADVTVRRRLSRQFDVSVAYRMIISPRIGREDRLAHVPILTVAARL